LPSSSSVVRDGYTLTSWNTEVDGKGTSYPPGTNVTLTSSLTLYAQWTSTGRKPSVLYGAIGDFSKDSTGLTASLERQVRDLANVLKTRNYTAVKLYGYTAATGLATLDMSLSKTRATNVANYLREQLHALKVTGVSIATAGEGSVGGKTSSLYSCVEVFVS
jgi:outer membrane protein OmpA-like peptidoglycan-associated protein